MKRNLVIAGILAALLFLVILAWFGARAYPEGGGSAKTDSAHEMPMTVTAHGLKVVVLDAALQAQAGIRTRPLTPVRYRARVSAYGVILDPLPLLKLRTSYTAALGQAGVARATVTAAQGEYERLRHLNRDGQNISIKTAQAAQAAYRSDQARLTAALANAASLRQMALTQWGPALGGWILGKVGDPLIRLFNGHDALLLVTLPPSLAIPSMPPVVHVESGKPTAYTDARLISTAPQSDPSVQGETYFYRMPAHHVRVGMRVAVDVPLAGQATQGIVVPDSAVLWYAGQAWVYLQTDAEHFVRHLVSTRNPVPSGWFETDIRPGQRVVTQGAQLLLSQELLAPPSASHEANEDQDND